MLFSPLLHPNFDPVIIVERSFESYVTRRKEEKGRLMLKETHATIFNSASMRKDQDIKSNDTNYVSEKSRPIDSTNERLIKKHDGGIE